VKEDDKSVLVDDGDGVSGGGDGMCSLRALEIDGVTIKEEGGNLWTQREKQDARVDLMIAMIWKEG